MCTIHTAKHVVNQDNNANAATALPMGENATNVPHPSLCAFSPTTYV